MWWAGRPGTVAEGSGLGREPCGLGTSLTLSGLLPFKISRDLGMRWDHLVLSPPDAVMKNTEPEGDRQLDSQVGSPWS